MLEANEIRKLAPNKYEWNEQTLTFCRVQE